MLCLGSSAWYEARDGRNGRAGTAHTAGEGEGSCGILDAYLHCGDHHTLRIHFHEGMLTIREISKYREIVLGIRIYPFKILFYRFN